MWCAASIRRDMIGCVERGRAVLPFFNDGAQYRIIVELNGRVGARVIMAGKPVAGRVDVKPAWFAPGFVDGAHHAVFDVRGDGGRVGGVLVGKVIHGAFVFLCCWVSSDYGMARVRSR